MGKILTHIHKQNYVSGSYDAIISTPVYHEAPPRLKNCCYSSGTLLNFYASPTPHCIDKALFLATPFCQANVSRSMYTRLQKGLVSEMSKSIVKGIGIGFLSCIGIGIGIAKTISQVLVLVLVLLRRQPKYWYWYC